ncbi:MAG: sulfurtransferase TusA family protein [Albidovulum sp.]|nr:sulfurtransferase TusA family protein [Albidovulum sp.]
MQKREESELLDATGLLCPLPVLKIRKRMKPLKPGQFLEVKADDVAALVDVPHFCDENGHTLVSHREDGDCMVFLIKKGAD